MARVKVIRFKGTKEYQGEAADALTDPGDAVLVERGVPRSLVMRCPDGCGETITVNLDERSGPAWRLFERDGKLTLYPSVWRKTGCRAHFILWRGGLIWCDWDEYPTWRDDSFRAQILAALPAADGSPIHFEELAAVLEAVPWDVLWACAALARLGTAVSFDKGTRFKRSAKHLTGKKGTI